MMAAKASTPSSGWVKVKSSRSMKLSLSAPEPPTLVSTTRSAQATSSSKEAPGGSGAAGRGAPARLPARVAASRPSS